MRGGGNHVVIPGAECCGVVAKNTAGAPFGAPADRIICLFKEYVYIFKSQGGASHDAHPYYAVNLLDIADDLFVGVAVDIE